MSKIATRICLLVALAASTLPAPPAVAQETTALIVEGWDPETRADGVTYYRCASEICAAGSVVSYKPQPHRPEITLAAFETHHKKLADMNRGSERIRDVVVSDAKERTIDGVRVLQISRDVTWADGSTTATIEARLIGPARSYSLVSDAPKREWTTNNFEGFLRNLVLFAGLEAQ